MQKNRRVLVVLCMLLTFAGTVEAGGGTEFQIDLVVTGNFISEKKVEVIDETGKKNVIARDLIQDNLKINAGTKISLRLNQTQLLSIFSKHDNEIRITNNQ